MKKLKFCMMIAFLSLSFIPSQLKAATENDDVSVVAAKAVESGDANAQLVRLNEIKAMDMSALNSSEKKELRKEVRAIKNDQDGRYRRYHDGGGRRYHDRRGGSDMDGRHGGGTVYVTVGGGLLIILLLIVLL